MRPDGPRPTVTGPDAGPAPTFPIKVSGPVIAGFGRGSKELGIPTANIPISGLSVGGHDDIDSGVYYGFCSLSPAEPSGAAAADATSPLPPPPPTTYRMVMSIGWNPFYKNTVRSVEVHILHSFPEDFYGQHLRLLILGYVRPEYDYVDKASLIEDIRTDCSVAERSLEREGYKVLEGSPYLKGEGKGETA